MAKWSCETTLKFIQEYKTHECLWDFQSAAYKDRNLRDVAYLKLVEAMNLPDFGVAEVKNKIKNLRSTYNQEKKKTEDSKKSGSGLSSVYESNVKWLKELEPTMKIGEKRKTYDNDDPGPVKSVLNDSPLDCDEDDSSFDASESQITEPSSSSRMTCTFKRPKLSKAKHVLDKISNQLEQVRAQKDSKLPHDAFGMNVAEQLRSLPPSMVAICKKLISDVLYYADIGTLDHTARIFIDTPSRGEHNDPVMSIKQESL